MKKSLISGIALALVFTLAISSLAMARGWGQHAGQGERGQLRGQECPVLSGLSEEQQQKLLQAATEHREWMYPRRQMMIARQAELNALLAAEPADQARIDQVRNELSALNQEIFEGKLNHRIRMSQEFNINPRMKGQMRGGHKTQQQQRAPRQGFQRLPSPHIH